MKKFLSNSLSGVAEGVGVPLGDGEVPTAGAVVVLVVVAGDIPGTVAVATVPGAAGVVPGTAGVIAGEVTGAVTGDVTGAVTGLVAVVGGAPGGRLAGGALAGGWPNEVSARVTEKRLAISSVFIGLIREFSRPRIPMSWVS
jgi:hypothetical protein